MLCPSRGVDTDPDAGRGHEWPTIDHDWRIQHVRQTCRGLGDLLGRGDAAQHDDEFAAPHAHHHVPGMHCSGDPTRNLLHQPVARVMAARIIDILEAIQVQKQHRQSSANAARLLDRHGQMRRQKQAIRQTGQLIVVRQVIQVLLPLELLRLDFATERHVPRAEGEERPMRNFESVSADLDVQTASAAAALHRLDEQPGRGITQLRGERIALSAVGSPKNVADPATAQLGKGNPYAAHEGGIGILDAQSRRIHQEHAMR